MKRATLRLDEAAKILGVCRTAAYAAAHSGDIPTIRIGKTFLVPIAALEKLIGAPIPQEDDK